MTRVKPGDRIAVEPATACHQCDQCLAGRPHTCRKLTFLGYPGQAEGCLADYILMKEESCYPIPEQMTLEEAALSEPLSIGLYAVKLSIPMRHARIGIPEVDRIAFSMDNMRRKEICIQNVRRRNHCVQAALNMIAGKLCDVNIMTTHRFPLERTHEAFDLVESYQDGVVKAMIEI
ncbi:MAG: alcohol dehydrogenase catalytic domain-containing protein [Lentisphaerota bacterium]